MGKQKLRGLILSDDEARTLWAGDQIEICRPANKRAIGIHGERLFIKEGHRDEHPLAIQRGRYCQPGTAGIPGPPGVRYYTIYRADGDPLPVWRQQGWPYRTLQRDLADPVTAKWPAENFELENGRRPHWWPVVDMNARQARQFVEIASITRRGDVVSYTLKKILRADATNRPEDFPC